MAAVPTVAIERAYGVTNIRSHIPLELDLDDHNYDAWRELFLKHCLAFDVLGHVEGTLVPTGDNDQSWKKRDGLVKLWIYGTLLSFDHHSKLEVRIENQFRNNKEARAIQLDNELRTKEIGDMSVKDYCHSLKSISDLLFNVDAPVTERTLVMYMLNGLNERFDYIINVIKHQKPFPTFEEAKSMLEMEEGRLKKPHKVSATHSDHASSSTALVASLPEPKPIQPLQQQKFNNYRSHRGNRRGRGRFNNNFQPRQPYMNWGNSPYLARPI